MAVTFARVRVTWGPRGAHFPVTAAAVSGGAGNVCPRCNVVAVLVIANRPPVVKDRFMCAYLDPRKACTPRSGFAAPPSPHVTIGSPRHRFVDRIPGFVPIPNTRWYVASTDAELPCRALPVTTTFFAHVLCARFTESPPPWSTLHLPPFVHSRDDMRSLQAVWPAQAQMGSSLPETDVGRIILCANYMQKCRVRETTTCLTRTLSAFESPVTRSRLVFFVNRVLRFCFCTFALHIPARDFTDIQISTFGDQRRPLRCVRC